MTTIAYDGRYIACDSQLTAGGVKHSGQKWCQWTDAEGTYLAIGAGDIASIRKAFIELSQGETPDLSDEDDTVVAVVHRGTLRWYAAGRSWVEPMPDTAGSGGIVADAGMRLGLRADEAVALACDVDLYTAGPVHCWDTQTLKAVRPRKYKRIS